MKRLLSVLVLCLIAIYSYGQLSMECDTTYFQCNAIFQDITKYNFILKKSHRETLKWATMLQGVFPVDKDDLLHFTYVVRTDSVVDMQQVKKVCADWYDIAFSSKRVAVKEQTDDYILGTGEFNMIGQTTIPAIFYYKIIKVHAQIDIIVRFKENRLRFEIIGRHYQYISGDSSGRSHNDLIIPGKAYPFVAEDNNYDRDVYAQAYINFCCNSLDLSRSFLDYLNKNIHPVVTQADDDW